MNNYYTYAYLREDRTPYYIGKGKGHRAYKRSGKPCSKPKDKSRIIFLKQNLTEEEAFKHEIYMISIFGRKDLGTGILHNRTNGGDGCSGLIFSEETKNKMSEIRKGKKHSIKTKKKISNSKKGGKNAFFGKTHSKESREKMKQNSWKNRGVPSPSSECWKLTFEDGRIEIVWGLFNWSKNNGYCKSSLYRVSQGRYKKHKDIISVEKLEPLGQFQNCP